MDTTSNSLLYKLSQPEFGSSWNRFVELYTPMLFYWSLRTGLSEADAEDLVQDVLLVVFAKVRSFDRRRDGSFRKWLQVVTLNKARERFRRRSLSIIRSDGEFDPLSDVADRSTIDEFWEVEYRGQLVHRAMQIMQSEFEPKTWRACWEHVVQERPAKEVAEELGLTTNQVWVYSSRVLKRLKDELNDLIED